MRIGLLTAAFPHALTEVAELGHRATATRCSRSPCWPRADGPSRRYAEVAHIDCAGLSDEQAKEIVGDLVDEGSRSPGWGTTPIRCTRTWPIGPR